MFSPNQKRLLSLFISTPSREYHLHEIGRLLGKKPGTFQKALNRLEDEGILESRMKGNQRLVSLNKEYPLLKEITRIIQKTVGIEGSIKGIVCREKGVFASYIFGSYAKNKMRGTSDIDLIIVGDSAVEDRILEEIEKIEKRVQREINLKFYTVGEYTKKKKKHDPFLEEILSDRYIVLKGKP